MKKLKSDNINLMVGSRPKVLVVTDAIPNSVFERGEVMTSPSMKMFLDEARRSGFDQEDFIFITPCPPIPGELEGSETRIGKFMEQYLEEFRGLIKPLVEGRKVKAVIALGKAGNRQLSGRPVQITKIRGTFGTRDVTGDLPVLPLLGPFHVLRRPEIRDIYDSDFRQIGALRDYGWSVEEFGRANNTGGYKWTNDISELIKNPPAAVAIDCETVGKDWHLPGFRILNVSITTRKGVSYVIPLDVEYARNEKLHGVQTPDWMKSLTTKQVDKMKAQLREFLGNPNVAVSGHNLKYDIHCLRTIDVTVENWFCDTMQLAFVIDDNMQSKSLDDCARRWLPTHAGYADEFNRKVDKSRMDVVPHDDMLAYAGGDTDVTYRLTSVMLKLAKEDELNYECFVKVQMPSLRTFVEMERVGVRIDKKALAELSELLEQREEELYSKLIRACPAKVLRKHEGNWNFASQKFCVDVLFGPDGIRDDEGKRLVPRVWTNSTKNLKDKSLRVPSTSAKMHLPYFEHVEFVRDLIAYSALQKLRSTYVGYPSSVEYVPVKRMASGALGKTMEEMLASVGIVIPPSKSERRRVKVLDLPVPDGQKHDVSITITGGKKVVTKKLSVDCYGNVWTRVETEATGFWQYLVPGADDIVHASFVLHGTNTGRSACRDPNLQNTPKRGDMAPAFRRVFLPAIKGWKWLELDYSQIELRVAAWMANDRAMIQIYREGGDIHAYTAAAVSGIPVKKFMKGRKDTTKLIEVANEWKGAGRYLQSLSPGARKEATVKDYLDLLRYRAKAINFGYLYGMWWKGFKVYAKTTYGIDYTDEEAEQTRIDFFRSYHDLESWHKVMKRKAAEKTSVRALHGALRRLDNITSFDEAIVGGAERQSVNSPVQRFASDLGLIALNRVYRDAPKNKMKPVMFVHDAVYPIVHPDAVHEIASATKYYMEHPPLKAWFGLNAPFPFVADVKVGDNLGDMEELHIEAKKPSWYRSGEVAPSQDRKEVAAWEVKRRRGIVLMDE
jgi:DNA polymerase I-like protein with 3'-5' exonuclease and polymerase domains